MLWTLEKGKNEQQFKLNKTINYSTIPLIETFNYNF